MVILVIKAWSTAMRFLTLFACLLATTGCAAFPPAQMRLPPSLAEFGIRMPVEGISGWTRGRFRAGEFSGTYERSEERLAFFDTFIRNSGHSDFQIEGPAISSTIEAECRMRERVLDFGIAEFTPKRMAYRCQFTADGYAMRARFELQEVRSGIGGALNRRARRGEIALGGEILQIRSVHRLEGSPLEMATPIGYLFEQRGRDVGALELNGAPVIVLADDIDEGVVRTMTIAAMALAIFWDPANSALSDI